MVEQPFQAGYNELIGGSKLNNCHRLFKSELWHVESSNELDGHF